MPLDIVMFRADQGGNPDKIRESQRRRFAPVELVDEIIDLDSRWRNMTGEIDGMKRDRNKIQKEVGNKKKAKEPCDDLIAQIGQIGKDIVRVETEQKELKIELDKKVGLIGNIVDDSVPVGQDEDTGNVVVRTWGNPKAPDASTLNHHDLLWRIGGYEPQRGTAVGGHRAYFLKDMGVLLNQALINYGIAFLRKRQYSVVQPPYLMRKEVMAGVAQLEQFDEELYKVQGDGEDKYLIATSEQPMCGYHMNEWMNESELPLRYAGVSTCFRKEAGKHGKDTWGIFRVHQFEKVEQFVLVEGDLAVSQAMQDEMILAAEEFHQSLGFPYQVINIVSGALNNAAIKKFDLECWFPGYNAYRELVSCSNCTDYQSRSMEIRSGGKKLGDREKKYVHMLNSTLCATGRAICCLLETYQQADGVRVPEVLQPYMGGIDFMPFVRESKLPEKVDKVETVFKGVTVSGEKK
jgi:seryl-tRNA synthetase